MATPASSRLTSTPSACKQLKVEAQSALSYIYVIRTTLAEMANIDDFRDHLDAAERTLLAY